MGRPALRTQALLRDYYRFVKQHGCLRCGALVDIEAAHIKPPSRKMRAAFAPRSHKGAAAFICIPLCSNCHRHDKNSLTNSKEADWLEQHIGPLAWIYAKITIRVAEWAASRLQLVTLADCN